MGGLPYSNPQLMLAPVSGLAAALILLAWAVVLASEPVLHIHTANYGVSPSQGNVDRYLMYCRSYTPQPLHLHQPSLIDRTLDNTAGLCA